MRVGRLLCDTHSELLEVRNLAEQHLERCPTNVLARTLSCGFDWRGMEEWEEWDLAALFLILTEFLSL